MTATMSVRRGDPAGLRDRRAGWRVLACLSAGLALSACTSLGASMEDMASGASNQTGFLPAQQRQPISFESAQSSDPQSSIGRSQHPRILAAYGLSLIHI